MHEVFVFAEGSIGDIGPVQSIGDVGVFWTGQDSGALERWNAATILFGYDVGPDSIRCNGWQSCRSGTF